MTAYISSCGYCRKTEFTNWYSKSAPHDPYGRVDRDFMDREPVAYCSEEHRDKADLIRAEVLAEAAEFLLSARVTRPVDEAEEHLNGVLIQLAAEVRTLRQGGAA
jgi:hypothetical protein